MSNVINAPAVRVVQNGHTMFMFSVDGKRLHSFAAVSHLNRDEAGAILGYQRPEVSAHIANIRQYLEKPDSLLPNAIIVAFSTPLDFDPISKKNDSLGMLTIPIPADGEPKPGCLVDGQQRSAAIRDANIDREFPMLVVAFVAKDEEDQREQFVLINSAKPLPKGLILELLPNMGEGASLPAATMKKKLASAILQRLNGDDGSAMKGKIKTLSNPDGLIQDGSVIRMLETSLHNGALSDFKTAGSEDENPTFDMDRALLLLKNFWGAVAKTWPEAWELSPKASRLTHAAGIVTLGMVMDASTARHRDDGLPSEKVFADELALIAPHCHWTEGSWKMGPGNVREWNSIQSTPKDVNAFAEFFLGLCKKLIPSWKRKAG